MTTATPTLTTTEIRPQAGPQSAFLASPADIALYGGAAGGGKTWALLLEQLRHIRNSLFGSVIFRRTSPQITNEGGMWDEASKVYPLLGGRPNNSRLRYQFPSGSKVTFAHMQYESDKHNWQGSQIPLICFDELTHFTQGQFFYMLSRNRSLSGVRPYIRATTNPDADSWVRGLVDWWIDENGYPIPERSGMIRWFIRIAGQFIWGSTKAELCEAYGDDVRPKSFTFIPSKLSDNAILMKKDPGYLANLLALNLVDQMRLLGGNWNIRPAAGKVFNRTWFEVVEAVPLGGLFCRGWDFAATARELTGNDPDFTAGTRMHYSGQQYAIDDVVAVQEGPSKTEEMFIATTIQDMVYARKRGTRYMVRWEIEPGSAGKRENVRFVKMLAKAARIAGLHPPDAGGKLSTGDKISRAKPLAAMARVGGVKIVAGAWNDDFLIHMHNQPEWPHDDIMDSAAIAYNEIGLEIEDDDSEIPGTQGYVTG